jgi:hypothetical protein
LKASKIDPAETKWNRREMNKGNEQGIQAELKTLNPFLVKRCKQHCTLAALETQKF